MSAVPHKDVRTPLSERYKTVRQQTLQLCEPLQAEDHQVQPMVDASPPKWHLAHVTWFFETFLLKRLVPGYQPFHEQFEMLFNSYYNGVGEPFPRSNRGNLSRPTLDEVRDYRRYVDAAMQSLLESRLEEDTVFQVNLGLNHEQQHQELILTDLKYNLGNNPLKPAYCEVTSDSVPGSAFRWIDVAGGLVSVGADGGEDFVFDNETPRHQVFLAPYQIANRPVTNGEYLAFMADGGYERAELWLSDGWAHLQSLGPGRWDKPLYWRRDGDTWLQYTLGGERQVDPAESVCHVSGYEADAYARWRGARLPTEFEWEHAVADAPVTGNFVEDRRFNPTANSGDGLLGAFGDVWEWTCSSYGPYPNYKPFPGLLGEYNGKFMANQLVLRGGSCASPQSHIRASYRNFFYPPDRWQFTGIRLAGDVH